MHHEDEYQVIADGNNYKLLANKEGTIYLLKSREDASTVQVEGHDMTTFLSDYEAVKAQYPNYDTDQILAQLWDQGGYSWMAVPDDE